MRAAACVSRKSFATLVLAGFHKAVARARRGTACLSSSSRRRLSPATNVVSPVRFASGRGDAATSWVTTGSSSETITMGIVLVAARAASIAGAPMATMTATFRRVSSSACCG